MKLGMKFTFTLFFAYLVGLALGGGWLTWASYRDVRATTKVEVQHILDALGPSLAPVVHAQDELAVKHFVAFVHRVLPLQGRVEVSDRTGRRIAAAGVPPQEATGIYASLTMPEVGVVGTVQVFLDQQGVSDLARKRQRPGGSAVFVAIMVSWILAEILTAFVVLSPIKKLHRALARVMRRSGPVDLGLLREEIRPKGGDELAQILRNTCALMERVRDEGVAPEPDAAE